MKERHIRVARTARYYTLGSAGPHVREVWFACHGIRQLARRFLPRFAGLDDGTRLIVAPEGLSRFYLSHGLSDRGEEIPVGATWMTREDRENEITDYVDFLDAVLDEATGNEEVAPLTVLGFSQGAHTVCRWVAAGEAPVARIILWGAYLPHDFDLDRGPDRLASAELILVRGLLDEFISEEAHASQEARIEELGVPFRTITHEGGHELDRAVLREIAGVSE